MKTYEQTIQEGYSKDWAFQCSKCQSYNCHKYFDIIVCFDCKNKKVVVL